MESCQHPRLPRAVVIFVFIFLGNTGEREGFAYKAVYMYPLIAGERFYTEMFVQLGENQD